MARLTEGELEVMRVLWEGGALIPAEIQERFPRPISNMALRSVLRVLVEKGHVTRRKAGKAYCYQAKTTRDRALKRMTRNMAEIFAGGAPLALIAQMIRMEGLSEEDIEELRKIAAGDAAKKSS